MLCPGQVQTISGAVTAFNKFPLKNVVVTAKKSRNEVLTDDDGKFEIIINKKDMLVFKARTFLTDRKRVKISDEPLNYSITLYCTIISQNITHAAFRA